MACSNGKRIALMTWFSYRNYGTALQVTALSHVLGSLGHKVDVVDYRPHGGYISRPIVPSAKDYAGKFVRKVRRRLAGSSSYLPAERDELFGQFLDDHLVLTPPCPTMAELEGLNDSYDAFVCGSDQIWAPSVHDPHYFLDFAGDDRLKVAYAPSVGLPKVADADVARQMARLCGRLDALSTREESGSEIVAGLTGREVATVIDPTLLLDGEGWYGLLGLESAAPDGSYLLAYMLGVNERHWKRVYALGERLGLPVRLVPVFERDLRRAGCITEPVGPREFVSLIAGAAYVCTDSFHGAAFSINLNRDFCVFERFKRDDSGSQNSRVYNILEKTGLRSRLAVDEVWDDELVVPIDWTEPNERLASERGRSLAWLEASLLKEPRASEHGDNVLRDRTLCCGCTACAVVCPVGAVEISLDEEGFWRARVDEEACVSCGRCRRVCPFVEHGDAVLACKGELFSFKCSDFGQLMRSSSGGAGATIARMAAADGVAVLGCAYEDGRGAVGRFAGPDDADGRASLAGSKYTQEEVGDALAAAASHDAPLCVFGTPCQVQAARNLMAARDDVTYVDFVCHGVPTRHLLDRYADWLHSEFGMNREGLHIDFRHKPSGWRERYIYSVDGERGHCEHQRKDPYFLMFEAGQCYAGCCYECPWRATSAADVRMADYWGPRFEGDKTGVSMVLAMTERGREIVDKLRLHGAVEAQPFDDYRLYQQNENHPTPVFRDALMARLADSKESIKDVSDEFAEPVAAARDILRLIGSLMSAVKRMVGRR